MGGIAPDEISYTSAVDACAKAGDWAEALRLHAEMERAGVRPSRQSVASLIKAHCRDRNQLAAAEDLFERYKKAGLASDVALRHLVCGLVKHHEWGKALYNSAARRPSARLTADAATYTGLIAAASNRLEIERALELLERMQEERMRPSAAVYTSLIKACGRTNRMDVAVRLFSEMVAKGVDKKDGKGSVVVDVVACNALLGACARRGWAKVSRSVFQFMESAGIRPDSNTYAQVIYAQARRGLHQRAQHYFDVMGEDGYPPLRTHYNGLIKAYTLAGDFNAALAILHRMREQSIEPDTSTYQSITRRADLKLDESDNEKREPLKTSDEVSELLRLLLSGSREEEVKS